MKPFKNGDYYVSIPEYEGGEVYKAEDVRRMFKSMRSQRDQFRKVSRFGLGSAHSEATRKAMADLLDWFIVNFDEDAP